MRESHIPTDFAQVTRGFAAFCAQHGLQVLYEAGDRHGSWEWAAVAQDQAAHLHRFVSMALTERVPVPSVPPKYLVEFWAEAEVDEAQRRVKRAKVHDFEI